MFSITDLLKKFLPVVLTAKEETKPAAYATISELTTLYKTTKGNSSINQKQFIARFNLQCIYIKRKMKDLNDVEIIIINPSQFKPQSMIALVDLKQLADLTELHPLIGRMADQYQPDDDLVKRMEPDVEQTEESDDEQDEPPTVQSKSAPSNLEDDYPLIELEEHEYFYDVNDKPVEIMIRGERTPDGILLRATDVAKFFEMDRLIKTLLESKYNYDEDIHFVVLGELSGNGLKNIPPGDIPSKHTTVDLEETKRSTGKRRVTHDDVYLTWLGLHRVIFASRSGNANVDHMAKWIMRLTYVHQLGSNAERTDLAATLTSFKCLHKIPGLYLIRVGKVKDLRETMCICEDTYPVNEYDSSYIYKFGRSDDIQHRVKDHQDSRRGYGRYSKTVELHWFININESVLSKAETNLSEFFSANGLKFEFTDERDAEHKELVIIKPGQERTMVKAKYLNLIQNFPSRENEILQMLSDTRDRFESELILRDEREARIRTEFELIHIKELAESNVKLAESKGETVEAIHSRELLQSKIGLLESESQLKLSMKDNDILKLRLQLAGVEI